MHDVESLVLAARAGDTGAWNDLVDRFAGLIWSIARAQGLGPSDASEVSQTTWLRLAEHIGDIKEPARIGAWLATTARRESIRLSRLGARNVLVDPWEFLEHVDAAAGAVDADLMRQERDLVVQQAMAQLPGRCRELLVSLVVADPPVSYATISETTGRPIGSIGPTRARCLEHLRRLIHSIEDERGLERAATEGSTS